MEVLNLCWAKSLCRTKPNFTQLVKNKSICRSKSGGARWK
jgi:hypothetical protein